jgi:hypothetical protein
MWQHKMLILISVHCRVKPEAEGLREMGLWEDGNNQPAQLHNHPRRREKDVVHIRMMVKKNVAENMAFSDL